MQMPRLGRFPGGWRHLAAVGLFAQRESETWRRSNYFKARISSPPSRQGWAFEASFLHSNTPSVTGSGYSYNQFTMGLRRIFEEVQGRVCPNRCPSVAHKNNLEVSVLFCFVTFGRGFLFWGGSS